VVTTAALDRAGDPPRVAYVVDRRLGSAVQRNTIRRRLRSAVRDHAASLQPGHAYLLRALPGVEKTPYGELSDTLRELIREHTRQER
jgi:ribonuclease P protein component